MREARAIGRCLKPLGLLYRVLATDRRLDVNRLGDVGVARFGNLVLGEIVSFGKSLEFVAPVSVEQLGVLHIVKMNVGVDEVKSGHMVESLPGSILDLFFKGVGRSTGRRM